VLEPVMRRHRSRGMSMIELLVGSAIGLLVAAAAGSVVSAHHGEARRQQIEGRLMQDLRGAAELVGRDLRRAGYWSAAASGVRGDDAAVLANPHAAIAPAGAASDGVALSFSTATGDATAVDDSERFGFRLRAGAIEVQLGARNWQALSDPGTLLVTSFTVEPRLDEVSLAAFCEQPCATGSTICPPRQQVRSYAIALAARSPIDARVTRSLQSSVRARNDRVVGSCEG
jgi:prepilin peptidase dependent protein B